MAKKQDKYDLRHKRNIKVYELRIDAIYREAIREAVAISGTAGQIKPDTPFSFDDYPITRKRIESLMSGLKSSMEAVILNGIKSEWTLANNKNSELANRVFGNNVGKLTQAQYRRYYSTNDAAREAFQQRKVGGLNLSNRVWRYTEQFKEEIEMGLDIGIRSGRSADELSRDLRQYLKQPDKLFRRVRDEHGQLQLSKRAKAYHPGQGVYRSSYKNARRLTATETNMAYRTSDHLRWQQMDFVVGIEIHLSNNHTLNGKPFHDICDELQGKYPKNFKFTSWHPHCRCFATSILKTPEEIAADTQKMLNGEPTDGESVNRVRDIPQAFKDWVENNKERIEKAKSTPYFIRDNQNIVDNILNPKPKTAIERAVIRHRLRTQEQVEAITRRARYRAKSIRAAQTYLKDFQDFSDSHVAALKKAYQRADWDTVRREALVLARRKRVIVSSGINTVNSAKEFPDIDISKLEEAIKTGNINNIQIERQKVEQLISKNITGTTALEPIIKKLSDAKIEHREVSNLERKLTDREIIGRLAGGDLTKGSCSSLAFAYAGNKAGFDVLDFRDGNSRKFFASRGNIKAIAEKVGGIINKGYNDFSNASQLLQHVEKDKEYYFVCGCHAAIIRKTDNGFEYLELQSAIQNGFKQLDETVLKKRFGAKQSHFAYGQKYETTVVLIDIDLLKRDAGFNKVLGYINTPKESQVKGASGTIK